MVRNGGRVRLKIIFDPRCNGGGAYYLGGGFKYFLMFTPTTLGNDPIFDEHIFQLKVETTTN